jgi:hypothetical protein
LALLSPAYHEKCNQKRKTAINVIGYVTYKRATYGFLLVLCSEAKNKKRPNPSFVFPKAEIRNTSDQLVSHPKDKELKATL